MRQYRGVGSSGEILMRPAPWPALAAAAIKAVAGIGVVALMFLSVAIWNRFPLVFYDTGAYLAEGIQGAFFVERSPVYSLFLAATGSALSLWPVVALQSLLTSYVIWEVAHCEVPRLSLTGFCGIGAGLTLLTGIAWYTGQVEPDSMTALVVLGSYLLLFRAGRLKTRVWLIAAITGLAVACHPSHLGLIGGLLICALMWSILAPKLRAMPPVRLKPALIALGLALALTLSANYALTRSVFLSRSGPVFVFARLMQDGIVKRLLQDSCTSPTTPYKLCAFKDRLATNANAWLWGNNPGFRAQGGFKGSQQEDGRIIADSIKRYPFLQIRAAIYESVLQFFEFKTGDGIESQEQILRPGIATMMPRQLRAYLEARQQKTVIHFRTLNMVHVTIGMLSLLGLVLLINHALVRRRWEEGILPALVLLALVGNAIICGTFSNPHDRYQSRLIWVASLCLLLARARDPKALQPAEEAG